MGHPLTVLVVLFGLSIAVSGQAGAQAAPAPAAAPAPIATADSETPGVQLQVTKLKRLGDSVMLQFVLINNSDSPYDPQKIDGSGVGRRNADGVFLVDLAGKKKYEVVRDSEKQCLCSHDLQPINAKSRLSVWARFPAPPDNVKKLGVVVPHFLPMDDVPLSP